MANNIKKDAISSYTNLIISILSGMAIVPIIESHIGKANFGIYQFVFTLTAYASLASMGLTKTVERYVAKYAVENDSEKESLIVSMVTSIYIGACILLGILIVVVYFQFGNMFSFSQEEVSVAKVAFLISAINATLNIPAMSFRSHLKGHGRYALVFNFETIYTLVRFVCIILLLNNDYGIIAVFLNDFCLTQVLNVSYAAYSIFKYKIKIRMFKFDRELFIKLFQFTLFISLCSVADMLYWNTNTVVLGIYSNSIVLAEFALSQRLITYFMRYATSFSGLFMPKFMEHYVNIDKEEAKGRLGQAFTEVSRIHTMLMSFAMVNFIVLGKEFIRLWVGESYDNTYIYAVVILLPLWVVLSQSCGIEIMYVMNKHRTRVKIYFFNAVLNVIATVVLVNKIGAIGAAISTAIALTIGSIILMNIYYKSILNLKLWNYFRNVFSKNFILSAIVIGIGFVMNYYSNQVSLHNFILKGLALNVIFLLGIYFVLMKNEEREKFKASIYKKIKTV